LVSCFSAVIVATGARCANVGFLGEMLTQGKKTESMRQIAEREHDRIHRIWIERCDVAYAIRKRKGSVLSGEIDDDRQVRVAMLHSGAMHQGAGRDDQIGRRNSLSG
jgi:hypothetical protein